MNINRSLSENENPTDIFRKSDNLYFFSSLSNTRNNSKSIKTKEERKENKSTDDKRTNRYQYEEHIHAVYLQGSKTMGPVALKTGIRLENTNMSGHQQIPKDTTFNLRRTDAFPYIYLSRSITKIAGYELRGYLVYRRSITRPSYGLLNPAIRILDPFLYELGNPSLRPQFTQNFEANISVDERLLFALGVNDILYTNRNDFFLSQGTVLANGSRFGDTRRFALKFRYNFGIRKNGEGGRHYGADAEFVRD
jgi:hypothetical protein